VFEHTTGYSSLEGEFQLGAVNFTPNIEVGGDILFDGDTGRTSSLLQSQDSLNNHLSILGVISGLLGSLGLASGGLLSLGGLGWSSWGHRGGSGSSSITRHLLL